ncbi:unnamed protein product [Didymodactylos carnosus]|uniref:MAP kinase-activating death domain protein n=1 Tax=Didymodactylos carnosus TaxID=1234261 RepID=A0A814RGJ4_9BILA|nr:unnamed protein product [Didymodactylos carnosus]CAF1133243.1 unnamed protein product [Didymodactylos carnosus]CAF3897066.1 unnamed protein product [Didymodactylos carnosus]CAF3917341.1 unnamed protein product [Didymodactylos carnosus]
MCEQTKKYFSPRLIDYVIIVGCRHPNRFNHVTQTPELLRRYPLNDHKDFSLPPDVIFFCQPEGCINTGHQRTGLRNITSFVFTLTEKDANRQRFGICVNFYRHFPRRTNQSTTASSTHQQTSTVKTSLPHRLSRIDSVGQYSSDDGTQQSVLTQIQQENSLLTDTNGNNLTLVERKRKRQRLRNNTLTSLCLISHHPFFTRFRECLIKLKSIIDACNERSCARRTGASRCTSRETVWGVLTGQSCECTSNLVAHEIREIETWILRLLSAPVSIPGKTKILIEVLPNESPMLFALPDHTRFSLVDFPLHLPLELLGVELCIRVLTLIMLENKVVFQSRDYNALTMSVLAFVALLYPLEYMFPVIPLLPTCMTGAEQLLLIPTPFLIGVPASFFPYKGLTKKFDDIWIVDLDSNQIIPPRIAEPFFDIPELEYNILNNHLKQALASMSMDPEPIQNFESLMLDKSYSNPHQLQLNSHDTLNTTTYNPFIYGNDVDSVDVATRVAMVRFFNSPNILGNFHEHTRTLRLHPRAVVAFQYSSFVRSRPIKSAFIIRLAKTQAVEFFAEWSLCPDNVAFLRVQTGVFDPALIGDKPKWYSRNLTLIPFNVIEENGTLGQAIHTLNAKQNNIEHTPTDESGSDSEDGSAGSCYSSLSDFVSEMRNSEICGEIRVVKIYPENQEQTSCVEYSSVYSPPQELQIPGDGQTSATSTHNNKSNSNAGSGTDSSLSMSESTISSSSNSVVNSGLNTPDDELQGIQREINENTDSKSSSATITPVTKSFPKPLFETKSLGGSSSPPTPELKTRLSQVQPNSNVNIGYRTNSMIRTNSHDSTNSPTTMKSGRTNKPEATDGSDTPSQSIIQHFGDELNSTAAARAVSNMAKIASDKVTKLLGNY